MSTEDLGHTDDGFLRPPGVQDVLASMLLGERVEDFVLLRLLSAVEGRWVFEARQDDPPRTVALKLVVEATPEAMGRERFRFETRTLGLLHHPGIAQVHRSGEASVGPAPDALWCAMEFVHDARSLTRFAAEEELDERARVELFAQVVEAVVHVHGHGIVHRDIKPENVLVDGEGHPKVIDFGIAAAVAGTTGSTGPALTKSGQVFGTLPYMAPEQCRGEPASPATDVYSLGVMLHELLTGELPYREGEELKKAPPVRVLTVVTGEPPLIRLSPRGELGDMRWVVAQALEKDPARRYASAKELGRDVANVLGGRSVTALAARPLHRARRAVQRHWRAAAMVGALLAAMIWWNVTTTKAAHAEDTVAGFLGDVLATLASAPVVDQWLGSGLASHEPVLTVVEALETRARDDLAGQTGLLQDVLELCGTLRDVLELPGIAAAPGQPQLAQQCIQLEEASSILAERLGPEHSLTLVAREALGILLHRRSQWKDARTVLEEVSQSMEATLGREDRRTQSALGWLALTLYLEGRYEEAETLWRSCLEVREGDYGPRDRGTLSARASLARTVWKRQRTEEARALFEDALDAQRRYLGSDHLDTAITENNLALLLRDLGQLGAAAEHMQVALEIVKELRGSSDPATLTLYNNLAGIQTLDGQTEKAAETFKTVLAAQLAVYDEGHFEVLGCRTNLGLVLSLLGRFEDARSELEAAAGGWEARARNVEEGAPPRALELLYATVCRREAAIATLWSGDGSAAGLALEELAAGLAPGDPQATTIAGWAGVAWLAAQDEVRAERTLLAVEDRARGLLDENSSQALAWTLGAARLAVARGDGEDAKGLLERGLAVAEETPPAAMLPATLHASLELDRARIEEAEDPGGARALLERALERLRAAGVAETHPLTIGVDSRLRSLDDQR